jgi:hypothetical protein
VKLKGLIAHPKFKNQMSDHFTSATFSSSRRTHFHIQIQTSCAGRNPSQVFSGRTHKLKKQITTVYCCVGILTGMRTLQIVHAHVDSSTLIPTHFDLWKEEEVPLRNINPDAELDLSHDMFL